MENEDKNMKVSFTPNPQGAMRVLAFLVLASLFIFLGARTWREVREARSFAPQNVITISGKSSIFATPDIGQVVISVVREQKTASDAQREATTAANKVIEFVESKGVKKEDIKTDYSIYPKYNYTQDRGQVLTGYEVRQSITVKIRDLDSISGILSGVVERGANEGGIPPPIFYEARSLGIGGAAPAPSPVINPGENEIISNVSVTYEIR